MNFDQVNPTERLLPSPCGHSHIWGEDATGFILVDKCSVGIFTMPSDTEAFN